MTPRARRDAIRLFLFCAACFAVFVVLLRMSGESLVPGGGGYQVQAVVPDALGLAVHADVRQAGVRIGEIAEVRERGNTSALLLELDGEHQPVYRDARVLVRTKTVAGETYLELDPGRPAAGALPDGGLLPIDRAQEATQIDEILSVLDARRRRQLQRALDGLGRGLDHNGDDLNRLLESSSGVTEYGSPVADVLAQERQHVASLVDSFGRVTRALGDRRDAIRLLVRRSRIAAEAVAARDDQLRATVAELPPFLRQSRATATRLMGFSTAATPVVRDLRLAVQDLVPAVEDLRPAAIAGRRTMRELDRFAVAAAPVLRQLPAFADAAAEFVPPLAGSLRQANPLLAYLAPYWRELSSFLAIVGAGTEMTDEIGHLGRIMPLVSRSSVPGTLSPAEEELLEAFNESLGQIGESVDTRGVNPYPAPGEAGLPKPFTGDYPRLEAEPPYR